jgi:outer membrane protein OmpA-like peptidoglycan-associated protein
MIHHTKLVVPDCPIDTAFCTPEPYLRIASDDTTKGYFDRNGYCYRIETVKGILSESDEYAISFDNSGNAFLTRAIVGNHTILPLRRNAVNNFKTSGKQLSDNNANVGFADFDNNIMVFAKSPLGMDFGESRIYTSSNYSSNINNADLIQFDDFQPDGHWISQPCIACNGEVILFASNHDTSYGGTDIVMSVKMPNGKFSAPVNIGRNINTDCDELTPFIDPKGNFMLFSSNGRDNVGGYDLFKSDLAPDFCKQIKSGNRNFDESFGQAVNLGKPINTIHDEIAPMIYSNKDSALYYASNQKVKDFKKQVFNIWVKFKVSDYTAPDAFYHEEAEISEVQTKDTVITSPEIIEPPKPEILVKKEIIVKGKVFDAHTNILLDSVMMVLRKVPYEQPEQLLFTDKSGAYSMKLLTETEYEITAQKYGYYFDTKRLIIGNNDAVQEMNFYLPQSGAIRVNFPLDEYLNPYKFTLDSNGNQTSRTWQEELDLVAENILLAPDKIDKVILVGHTDDIGTDEYNMQLGQRRVEFIIEQLVKRQVPRNILIGRSAGEREQLTRRYNENIDTYRKRLRRVMIDKFYK